MPRAAAYNYPVNNDFDVCVRGAGCVGMAAALGLARGGLRVALAGQEQAPQQGDIRAYALNAGSLALLAQLKVWEALPEDARTPVYDMHIEGDAHGAVLDFSAWAQATEALAWIADAAALDDALRAALRFAPHVQWVGAAEVNAPLHVLAEGRASAARQALGVQWSSHDYGHQAVATRLLADAPHRGQARQWLRAPEVLALLPFDRPQPDHGYALVWSVPDARATELMVLGDAAFEQALNEATLGAAGTLRLAGERTSWPLALGRAQPICGPGWVLLGDAAHVIHPLAGQGLNLGLADVASLCQVVSQREPWRALGDERMLRRHARARLGPTLAMSGVTDGLWQLFAHPHPLARELRNRGLTLVQHLGPLKRFLAARALHS